MKLTPFAFDCPGMITHRTALAFFGFFDRRFDLFGIMSIDLDHFQPKARHFSLSGSGERTSF